MKNALKIELFCISSIFSAPCCIGPYSFNISLSPSPFFLLFERERNLMVGIIWVSSHDCIDGLKRKLG